MRFRPIQQSQFKLGHALQQVRIDLAVHLPLHIGNNLGNPLVTGMGFVGHQQIQLGVFFDLHAQLVQTLDGGIAGEEVLGTGAKGDDLQIFHTDDGPGDRNEFPDHLRAFFGGAHGVLGDVGSQVPHTQIVRAVQHTAVGITTAVDQVAVTLGSSNAHGGTVEFLDQQRLRGFGAEVAQEHHQGVDAVGFHVRQGSQGVLLILHGDGALVDSLAVGGHNVLATLP